MKYSLLNLGDSYTIGEGVPLHENFPYITVQQLRKQNVYFHAPEIIAKTGWTSFDLIEQLNKTILENSYDFVTLLVGVNNQYRGLQVEDFRKDFEYLINKALALLNNNSSRLIILSIPDWGKTIFAKDREEMQISNGIDAYNGACEMLAQKYQTHFINITDSTRKAKENTSLLTSDGLHYSATEHLGWAKKVVEIIMKEI